MQIFLISGNARNGKDSTGNFIIDYLKENNRSFVKTQYSKYIKMYTKELTTWDGSEETKGDYRDFLQEIGTELIRKKMNQPQFFVNRMIDDIKVYENYVNNVIITDVRFPIEIEKIKSNFDHVYSIRVIRENFENNLNQIQKKHDTETSLTDEMDYDYVLTASNLDELKKEVIKLIESIDENEKIN